MSTQRRIAFGITVTLGLVGLAWFAATSEAPVPPTPVAPPSPPSPSASVSAPPDVFPARPEVARAPDAGEAPEPSPAISRPPMPPADAESALRGVQTRELTAQDRVDLKLPERLWGGVVVTAVDPTSPAAEARIQNNDVIFRAHGAKITSMDDLLRAVGEREQTRIQAYRNGAAFEVVLHRPFHKGAAE